SANRSSLLAGSKLSFGDVMIYVILNKIVHKDGPAYVPHSSIVAILEAEDPQSQRAIGFTAKFDG
ncbi:hypothetical protein, partial [Burkholderia ubonensis]|uniref:hypothetical protein n=1 Tax=Burkholderia ubonensis TaxID=101571 RepID=UPI001E577E14